MTSRELTFGFDFWSCFISAWPWYASTHQVWCKYVCPIRCYWHFPKSNMALAAILYFQVMWIWHSGMLIVWCLSFVQNLVQISVIVTEIDALMIQTFIWWRSFDDVTWIITFGFDFWSRGHLRMAVTHLPTKFGANSFIQFRVIDIFQKSNMLYHFRVIWR